MFGDHLLGVLVWELHMQQYALLEVFVSVHQRISQTLHVALRSTIDCVACTPFPLISRRSHKTTFTRVPAAISERDGDSFRQG